MRDVASATRGIMIFRRRAREPIGAVVFGEPVAVVAPPFAGLGQLDGLSDRVLFGAAAAHGRLIEDADFEWCHGLAVLRMPWKGERLGRIGGKFATSIGTFRRVSRDRYAARACACWAIKTPTKTAAPATICRILMGSASSTQATAAETTGMSSMLTATSDAEICASE